MHFWNDVISKGHLCHLLYLGIGSLMKSAESSIHEGLRLKLQVTLSYNKKALGSIRSLALALLIERAS